MKNFLQKLKTNKGATGADIIVALSVLTIAMAVVSVIFVNMQGMNKQVNRMAGATRIATNIMENMRASVNADTFTQTGNDDGYNKIEVDIAGSKQNVKAAPNHRIEKIIGDGRVIIRHANAQISSAAGNSIYNTTIPNGYTAKLTFQAWPYNATVDAVARVIIEVSYKVGEQTKSVTLSTGIARGAKANW